MSRTEFTRTRSKKRNHSCSRFYNSGGQIAKEKSRLVRFSRHGSLVNSGNCHWTPELCLKKTPGSGAEPQVRCDRTGGGLSRVAGQSFDAPAESPNTLRARRGMDELPCTNPTAAAHVPRSIGRDEYWDGVRACIPFRDDAQAAVHWGIEALPQPTAGT